MKKTNTHCNKQEEIIQNISFNIIFDMFLISSFQYVGRCNIAFRWKTSAKTL